MKKYYLLLFTLFLTSCTCASKANSTDPVVVSTVDLNKYSGLWYEIARYPNFFQRNCLKSTAEYQVIDNNSISVHNTCYKKEGEISDIKGTATIPDPNVPAKLKVKFNFFARGDYWIVDLDDNYQISIVSSPEKEYLFVLSRTAPLSTEQMSALLKKLTILGFNTEELIYDQYN